MAASVSQSVLNAYSSGLLDASTALQELKRASVENGVFSAITDDLINAAKLDDVPTPEVLSDGS